MRRMRVLKATKKCINKIKSIKIINIYITRINKAYEIAEKHKLNVFGIALSVFIGVVGVLQMDMMYWCEKLWQEAHDEMWFPELGISKLHAWEMFGILVFLAILIMGVSCITWKSEK